MVLKLNKWYNSNPLRYYKSIYSKVENTAMVWLVSVPHRHYKSSVGDCETFVNVNMKMFKN
jgi:hypothetical protein